VQPCGLRPKLLLLLNHRRIVCGQPRRLWQLLLRGLQPPLLLLQRLQLRLLLWGKPLLLLVCPRRLSQRQRGRWVLLLPQLLPQPRLAQLFQLPQLPQLPHLPQLRLRRHLLLRQLILLLHLRG
jgi:hypothetical protein